MSLRFFTVRLTPIRSEAAHTFIFTTRQANGLRSEKKIDYLFNGSSKVGKLEKNANWTASPGTNN